MKNKPAIASLFIANTVSGMAQGMSMIAIPWYFTTLVHQESLFGRIYAIITFGALFWGLYSGTLVDKFDRKKIFLAENFMGTLVLFSVSAAGFWYGQVPIALVALVFATTFYTYNIHYPALYAFLQEITDREDYGRVVSYIEIQGQITSAIAGAMAAILLQGVPAGDINLLGWHINLPFSIPAWQLHHVFLLDGATYLLSFLLILPIKYTPTIHRHAEDGNAFQRLRVGFNYFQKRWVLFVFGNAALFVFVTTLVINMQVFPNFVKNDLHANANVYAWAEVAFATGAIFAGVWVMRLFKHQSQVLGNIVLASISATCFAVLIVSRSIWVFYVLNLLLGWANAGSRIMRTTYLFQHIPNQVSGRANSVFYVINVLCRLALIYLFSFPFFIQQVSYTFAVLSAWCLLAAAILMWYYKRLVKLKGDETS